jgi:hypothetical protein
MRFIGNQPIPEHVNPPEDLTAPEPVQEERKPPNKETAQAATNQPDGRKRRGRPSTKKQGDRQAA